MTRDRAFVRANLAAVLLLAAAARLADLDWDDGHAFHPDERAIVFGVQRLSFSPPQLDPGFYAYGSFPLYLIRGVSSALGLVRPALREDFGSIVLVGRALSALAGVLTVWALFRLVRRLWGEWAAVLAAALLACAPLHIQCSHFLTTDIALTLMALLAVHACIDLAERARSRDALRAGAWVGLALAIKVSAAPLLAPLAIALVLVRGRGALVRAGQAVAALVAAALAGQPYAVLAFPEFWRQVSEQGAMVRSAGSLPYTIQYVGVWRYAYDAWQLVAWGMGPILGLAALWATGRALLGTLRGLGKPRELTASALLLASWVVPYVLLMGWLQVKYPRYLLPVYPFLLGWAGAWLAEARVTRRGRALGAAVVAGGALTALAFLSVYRGPHTAVAASEWVYANVPEGSTLLTQHWDEGFPLPTAGRDPSRYRVVDFPFYEPDGPEKRDQLARAVADADAVVLPTRRILGAVTRVPDRYPLTNAFYRLLFAGRLGFTFAHEQSARPRLGPLEYPDELLDESVTVYDHPKVLVFLKGERLEADEIARRLGEVADATARAELLAYGRARRAPFGLVWGADPVRQGALALVWWAIAVEALALAAYAFAARWLPRVGGFALARVLGVLLLAWPAWWLGHLSEQAFTPGTLVVLFGAIAGLGAWAWWRGVRWPRDGVLVEVLFWGAFAVFVLVRAGNPAVSWGEKPMDFAFLNTLTRATSLPPPEPWFAGSVLHYTWFGHFAAASIGKLCGLHPGVTFNLAIALVGALAVAGAYALGAIAGRGRRVGVLCAVLVTLVGNLAGAVELWRRQAPFDAFWAASRVMPDAINEYPLWSFLFADLHAHVLVLPFALAFLALVVGHARAPLGARTRPRLALLALLLGTVVVTNGWSGVTYPLLLPLLLLLAPGGPRDARTLLLRVIAPTAVVWMGATAAFLPFWSAYRPPERNWGLERASFAAFPAYALVFGLFLAIAGPLLLRGLAPRAHRLGAAGVLIVSAALSVVRPGWGAWRVGMLVLAVLAAWAAVRPSTTTRTQTAAALLAGGFLITAAADLVFLWDRMNTVFKLYLDAWLLMAAGCAVALPLLWRSLGGPWGRAWRAAVLVLGAVAAATGWQGAYAVVRQPREVSPRPTLDGTAYLRVSDRWEADAIDWLNAEVRGTPVVAEAWGPLYGESARVSMNTGLPTILGWDYHVHQRAHDWPSIEARKADVARLFETRDAGEARDVLDRYAVRYVYIGELERGTYGTETADRLASFTGLLQPVYRNPGVLILAARQVAGAPPLAPQAPPRPASAPPGSMREPRAVAVDESGRVFVADFGHHRVQVLGADLEPLAAYGGRGAGPGLFEQPCALAAGGGRVYVADTWNGRVQVMAPDGRTVGEWRGSFFGPRGIAIAPDGRVYLADTGNHCIRVFDRDGKELATWGRRGGGPGEMEEPMGVAADDRGRAYVCDNGNGRVQVLEATGAFVRSFPVPGWRTAAYSEPKIAAAPSGVIWVTVPLADVVRAYDAGGTLLRELRGPEKGAPFRTPLGLAFDPHGPSLLVTDLEDRVVRVPLPPEAPR